MGEGGINNNIINSGSGLDLFPRPLGWRDSRSAAFAENSRPILPREPHCRALRRPSARAEGTGGAFGIEQRTRGLFFFYFSLTPRQSVPREAGRGGIRSPPRTLKKTPLPFFFKRHFLKGFLRVFRLGGRGWESGASAAPPNHPACCAQSQPASPRLGAGLSTEGRTVTAAQGSPAWNALGAHSTAGRWSPLFLRRGPRGWLCRPGCASAG